MFIAFDWCGWNGNYGRFTHIPSGDTLVQPDCIGQREWDQAQMKWFSKYPQLTVHRCPEGPYRETGDTMGTTDEVVTRLKERLAERWRDELDL